MTRGRRALVAAVLLPVVLGLGAGCEIGQDDEMARPTRTVTASPTPKAVAAPAQIPVGDGAVSADDVVWGDGPDLHVERRSVDLSPATVDQLVRVPGGVYVLSGDELWFTDLQRLRGTGLTAVTRIALSEDGERLLVTDTAAGREAVHAYDVRTGKRVDTSRTPSPSPSPTLRQPGSSVTAFKGYPADFALAGWAGDSTFYGVAGKGDKPTSVVSCRVTTRTCAVLGSITGPDPVVFPPTA
ncbi:MAG: hypothetical protein ABWY19_10175 [Marmoricola sp.]